MNEPIRVSLWHRKNGGEKTWTVRKRIAVGLLAFVVPLAITYGDALTYDFDGSDLTIRKEQLYGLMKDRETRIPLPDKVVFETESRDKGWLGVVDGGGHCLRVDKLGKDAERFRDGLTQAVQKCPRGTFHGKHRKDLRLSELLSWFGMALVVASVPVKAKKTKSLRERG